MPPSPEARGDRTEPPGCALRANRRTPVLRGGRRSRPSERVVDADSDAQGNPARIWGISSAEYLRVADPWPLNPDGEILLGVKV